MTEPNVHRIAALALLTLVGAALIGCGGEDGGTDEMPEPEPGMADGSVEDEGPPEPVDMGGTRCLRDDQCPEGEYCPPGEGGMPGICAVGCREGGCEIGLRCNLEERFCERDPSCESDTDCEANEYCDGALCQLGCRLDDPDACPRNADGEPRGCDPETRACAVQVVCCGGDDSCSLELPAACDDPLPGLRNCVNPNPCALRCDTDDDCADDAWCDDGSCAPGCRTERDNCGPERVCDPESRNCTRPRCQTDDDCGGALYCDVDVCLPGCRQAPDNCGLRQFCDEQHRCVPEEDEPDEPCVDDAECDQENAGWICEGGVCESPCLAHEECAEGLACVDGRCVDGCRDDDYEENDAREDAAALRFDGPGFGPEQGLVACRRDRDWYRFDVPSAGSSIRVVLNFVHADGDLDVRLYGPDGRVFAEGTSADDDELIEYLAGPGNPSPAGTWWVEVYARGLDENVYSLELELLGGVGPDAAEPDDAPVTSTVLFLPDQEAAQLIEDRTIHPGDEDWFSIDMGARDGVQIRLDMLGNGTGQNDDLTFEIYGPGAPGPADDPVALPNGGGGGDNSPRFVQFDAPRFNAIIQDGRYYVRVVPLDQARFGRYRLNVAVDRNGVLCLPDDAEPNDVAQVAFDLMTVDDFVRRGLDGVSELRPDLDLVLPGRTLCEEEDWYSLLLRPNDDLEVRVERIDPEIAGDTIIELRDALGGLITSGRSGQRVNVARLDRVEGGRYLVRVQAAGGVRTGYDLAVLRSAGPVECAPDVFDAAARNDQRDAATLVEPGAIAGLTLCGVDGDADWYRFETDTLATLDINLRFAHVLGDLELDVYFEDDPVALNAESPAGHSGDDDERVILENRAPGTYFLRVRGLGDPNAVYDLDVRVAERVFVCEDDPDEPNTAFDDAVLLGRREADRAEQWLCVRAPADIDTFLLSVPAGESRVVAASYIFGDDGDLYLDVFDDDQMLRVTTADVNRGNSKQCVVIAASDVNRTYFVQVQALSINQVGEDDERLDYRLRVEAGEDCEAIPPATPGVIWPTIRD